MVLIIGAVVVGSMSCSSYVAPTLPARKPVVPVSGEVRVDGKAVEGVVVTLHPKGHNDGLYQYPSAVTDAEGQFELGTYEEEDGAPAGEYVAIFVWPLPEEEQIIEFDKLKRLYCDPKKSPFRVTVAEEPLVLRPFDLKLQGLEGKPLSQDEITELEIRKEQRAAAAAK
ncbi:MAG TPA: hypothetical protein VGM05_01445 [Planctomycetaceae bacterium]|jgi:hypothetical protein